MSRLEQSTLKVIGCGGTPALYNARHGGEHRTLSGYVLGGSTVIDASPGLGDRIEAVGIPPEQISELVISHTHADHCELMGFVHRTWSMHREQCRQQGEYDPPAFDIYGPPGMEDAYRPLMQDSREKTGQHLNIQWHEFADGKPFELSDGIVATPYRVVHGNKEAYAIRFEDGRSVFTYSGDSGDCPALRKAAEGADLFLCEAGLQIEAGDSGLRTHLKPRVAGSVAQEAEVAALALTHLPGYDPDNNIAEEATKGFGNANALHVCHDGDVLEIVNLFRR